MAKAKHKSKSRPKKKGKEKKKKKKVKPAAKKNGSLSKFGMVESKFIARLRAEFLGAAGATLWGPGFASPADPNLKAKIGADLGDAFRSMFLVLEDTVNSPAPLPGTADSATQRVASVITATGWPNNDTDFPVPNVWDDADQVFRRYEIACAVNIFLQAYNAHGPGGPPEWPPHKPS